MPNIITVDVENNINQLRNGNDFTLNKLPKNETEAWGGICSYLKGTAEFEKEKIETRILNCKEFKQLGVSNFRTKRAREYRDRKLSVVPINFLTQSFRYRGKANYRDSVYLSYGEDNSYLLNPFLKDLELVSKKYFLMSFALIKQCINKTHLGLFINDAIKNVKFSLDKNLLQ